MRLNNGISCVPVVLFLAGMGIAPAANAASALYAPSEADSPSFRAALRLLIGGDVDYFDARYMTPTVDLMIQYDSVLTWKNYSYWNPVEFGNNLADYADLGGRVILGQWCCPDGLGGRIMQPEYCPVAALGATWEPYAGDGVDCVHDGVGSYNSVPITALQPGAQADGTLIPSGLPGIAWRGDRRVYCGPGNTCEMYGGGDWLHLTANMILCPYKWQQPPEPAHPQNVYYGWNQFSEWCYGPVVADDWFCSTPEPVTEIHWWGSFIGWKEPTPPAQWPPLTHFHIQFWTDVPADPSMPGDFSHPGTVIHEVFCYNYTCEFGGWDFDPQMQEYEACFRFSEVLHPEQYFYQPLPPPGSIFWISIAACYD